MSTILSKAPVEVLLTVMQDYEAMRSCSAPRAHEDTIHDFDTPQAFAAVKALASRWRF